MRLHVRAQTVRVALLGVCEDAEFADRVGEELRIAEALRRRVGRLEGSPRALEVRPQAVCCRLLQSVNLFPTTAALSVLRAPQAGMECTRR